MKSASPHLPVSRWPLFIGEYYYHPWLNSIQFYTAKHSCAFYLCISLTKPLNKAWWFTNSQTQALTREEESTMVVIVLIVVLVFVINQCDDKFMILV